MIIPADNTALSDLAEEVVAEIRAALVAIEFIITPNGYAQPNLQHDQVDYPYWRNLIMSTLDEDSASPNYGTDFERTRIGVIAELHVGKVQADGIEVIAEQYLVSGQWQWARRTRLQSPTYPNGLSYIDPTTNDTRIFRGANRTYPDDTAGMDMVITYRLSIPIIYENNDLSEV